MGGYELRRKNRVEVEIVKDDLVPGIGQILYHVFKLIANAFNFVVGWYLKNTLMKFGSFFSSCTLLYI